MSDFIRKGVVRLAQQQKDRVSQAITYVRGAQSCVINVTVGKDVLRTSDREGNTKVERADFDGTFTATDLDFGAGAVEPAEGDILQVTFGTVTKQFRVAPINGQPGWSYLPYEIQVRVHGKYIGNV